MTDLSPFVVGLLIAALRNSVKASANSTRHLTFEQHQAMLRGAELLARLDKSETQQGVEP